MKIHQISNSGFQEMDLSFGTSLGEVGGDSDLAVLRIKTDHSMTMGLRFKPVGAPLVFAGEVEDVEITLRGGMEIGALIDLMRLAIAVCEAQSQGNEPKFERMIHEEPIYRYKCQSIYGGTIEKDDDLIAASMGISDLDFTVEPGSEE